MVKLLLGLDADWTILKPLMLLPLPKARWAVRRPMLIVCSFNSASSKGCRCSFPVPASFLRPSSTPWIHQKSIDYRCRFNPHRFFPKKPYHHLINVIRAS
jgi:hypothetical protein